MEATQTQVHDETSHDVHHHDPGFWRQYIFSSDHKVIGIQYGVTALIFLLMGFVLIASMRWSIAYPGKPVPVMGPIFEATLGDVASGGVISNDLYN